jgi:hypothetical protein
MDRGNLIQTTQENAPLVGAAELRKVDGFGGRAVDSSQHADVEHLLRARDVSFRFTLDCGSFSAPRRTVEMMRT